MKVHPGRKHKLAGGGALANATFGGGGVADAWGLATFGGGGVADGIHLPMLSVFQSTLLNVPMGGGGAVGSVGGGGGEAAFARTE